MIGTLVTFVLLMYGGSDSESAGGIVSFVTTSVVALESPAPFVSVTEIVSGPSRR